MSCDCCVALHRVAMGLSAVYNCGIPDHVHYFLCAVLVLGCGLSGTLQLVEEVAGCFAF